MLNNILNLKGVAVLGKKQQQNILGGYGGTCAAYIPGGSSIGGSFMEVHQYNGVELGAPYPSGTVTSVATTIMGASKDEVLALTQGIEGAHWCCASCSTASWL